MDRVVPWAQRVDLIAPHYSAGHTVRPPFELETMLRTHFFSNGSFCRIKDLIEASANRTTLAAPVKFKDCLEVFLGIPLSERDDKNPVEIIKAIASNAIDPARLQVLRSQFCTALAT